MKKYTFMIRPKPTFILLIIVSCCFLGHIRPVHAMQKEPSLTAAQNFKQQIDQLAKAKSISKALQLIEDTDTQTIEDQKTLTELPAPPFKEDQFGRSKRFAELLEEYGADSVWTDSIGNVIGLRKGTKRDSVLALAAHLDTVFPEGTDVNVTQKGDTLFAPGISDDGRGLTTVLTVLRAFDANNIQTRSDILFIGDVGEEGLGDLRGMKHLFRDNGPEIDAFISIDGSGSSSITNGALGSHRYRVTFEGPGGHSWGAFGLVNPHHALGQAITNFVKLADDYTSDGPKTSYNVGRIGGGTSVNSIPFEAWMEVDMRSLSQERLNKIDTLFHEAVQNALDTQNSIRRSGPPLSVNIKMIGDRPSGTTDPNIPLVQRAMAVREHVGKKLYLSTSSTDSNIPISIGVPAITLDGGGAGGGAHSLDEWYVNEEGYKGIQRVFLIIAAQAGVELE
jgi:acetylornithine deacetylase/succinyl-diaminopimelate desuccinylase-like protein